MQQRNRAGRYHIGTDLIVQAPAEKVWDVLADFSAVDTWVPLVTKSYVVGDKDRGVGVQRRCNLERFGEISEVVTEWNEGRSLSYRVSSLGPLQFSQNSWTLVEIDETSCKVVLDLDYDMRFGVVGRLMHALVMGKLLRKRIPNAIQLLKKRAETGELVRPRRSLANEPQLSST